MIKTAILVMGIAIILMGVAILYLWHEVEGLTSFIIKAITQGVREVYAHRDGERYGAIRKPNVHDISKDIFDEGRVKNEESL